MVKHIEELALESQLQPNTLNATFRRVIMILSLLIVRKMRQARAGADQSGGLPLNAKQVLTGPARAR
jgi:hypothetical protein